MLKSYPLQYDVCITRWSMNPYINIHCSPFLQKVLNLEERAQLEQLREDTAAFGEGQ